MTKKELMVKAHKMTKEIKSEYPTVNYKFQLGLCLSYLQNEGENEMVELKGSEKQIAWAEKIRKEEVEKMDRIVKEMENTIETAKFKTRPTEILNKMVELVAQAKKECSAKYWIDRRDVCANNLKALAAKREL